MKFIKKYILIFFIFIIFLEIFLWLLSPFLKFDRSIKVLKNQTILCVGDSFCYGAGLKDEESYPFILENILKDNQYNYSVINKGAPGQNSLYVIDVLNKYLPYYKPDIVFIQTGIDNYFNFSGHENKFKNLISYIKSYRLFLILYQWNKRDNMRYDKERIHIEDIWDITKKDLIFPKPHDYDLKDYKLQNIYSKDKPGWDHLYRHEFYEALKIFNKNEDHCGIILCNLQQGFINKAWEYWDSNSKKISDKNKKNNIYIELLLSTNRIKEALNEYKKIIQNKDIPIETILLICDIAEMFNFNEIAYSWAKNIYNYNKSEDSSSYFLSLSMDRDYKNSLSLLNKIYSKYNDNLYIKYLYFNYLYENNKFDKAQSLFKELNSNILTQQILLTKAYKEIENNDFDKANIFIDKAYYLNKDNYNFLIECAFLFQYDMPKNEENFERSKLFLKKAYENNKSNFVLFMNTDLHIFYKKYKEALFILDSINPESIYEKKEVLKRKIDISFFTGNYEKTSEYLIKLSKLFENKKINIALLEEAAKYYKVNNNPEMALKIYRKTNNIDEIKNIKKYMLQKNSNKNISKWIEKDLLKIAKLCKEYNAKPIFMNYFEEKIPEMKKISNEKNILFLDIFNKYNKDHNREELFQPDSHLTFLGNQMNANMMYDFLKEKNLLKYNNK